MKSQEMGPERPNNRSGNCTQNYTVLFE